MFPQIKFLLLAAVMRVLDTTWRTRNKAIFQGNTTSIYHCIAYVKGWLINVDKITGSMNIIEDHIFQSFKVLGVPKRTPPPTRWLKLDTDGLALGAPRVSPVGGFFRTSRIFVKGSFCGTTGNSQSILC